MAFSAKHSQLFDFLVIGILICPMTTRGEDWPRWRGPAGNATSSEKDLPVEWDSTRNVRWKVEIPGDGVSSPIVWGDKIFVTSSLDYGRDRILHCLDRNSGQTLWSQSIHDDDPELTSALTGYAAPTAVTNGKQVVAFFGRGGLVCYDLGGNQQWHRRFGEFESELGIATSPIIHGNHVILVCDHDGTRFSTFDSFLIAIDLASGKTAWKTDRRGLFRSWSTPIVVPTAGAQSEIVVNAQDELRGYDPANGTLLWQVTGMTGWVTPSPVFADGLIFATSGRDGPTLAVKPGGRGDVSESHVVWRIDRGSPYVCSPLCYQGLLYVHSEQGILSCYEAVSGEVQYRQRLGGTFKSSGVAGDGKVYLPNEQGETVVLAAGREYRELARCPLQEESLASPAISGGTIFLRTLNNLYCIEEQK